MTQTKVNLTKEELEVLRNVSSINNSLKFKPGNVIKTMSPCQSILMEAEIESVFPQEFSIYELSKLLNVLGLPTLRDAALVFEDDKKLTIDGGTSRVQYYFTDQSFVNHPDKVVNLPSVDLSVLIQGETLDGFVKAASTLNHKILAFRVQDGVASLVATSPEIDTSNDYVVDLGDGVDGDGAIAADGNYRLKVENLKILPGDYKFEICKAGIIRLTHTTRKIVYFLGLERS